ncbi:MAG TPA: glycosyltransferase family 4 protein [Usitatibacter sp.]|nr:glycosyltransferase family 4 protein [Usitatibacter sp.]
MSAAQWIAIGVIPGAIAWIVIFALARSRFAGRLADVPNERSLHQVPTPRIGGLGLMVGALPIAWAFATPQLATILGAAVFLCALSFADDLRSLPVQVRLAGHFTAAAIVVLALQGGEPMRPGLVESLVVVLAIVWMTNLFNFMDGSDGLAGGMAAIGFAALSLAAAASGHASLAAISAIFVSASAGFLAHNFPPARVFMGDAGSVPLGFLAGALGFAGWMDGAWPLFFPVAVFAPFIADASITLARRIVRSEPFWRAHRTHAYQRLILAGWTRRQLALRAYGLMLASVAAAFAALTVGETARLGIIVGCAAIYLVLFTAIEVRVRAQ